MSLFKSDKLVAFQIPIIVFLFILLIGLIKIFIFMDAKNSKKSDTPVKTENNEPAKGSIGTATVEPNMPQSEPAPENGRDLTDVDMLFTDALRKGLPEDGALLIVNSDAQKITLVRFAAKPVSYMISTASNGIGSKANSGKTPAGWHKVDERIGKGEPIGRLFKSRQATSRILTGAELRDETGGDAVVSRILWLRGMEPGLNSGSDVDSHDRMIYIHGTDQEHLLGKPVSHGCIRMSNEDVIKLFARIEDMETWCYIH